jgi:hypothetical protein
MNQTVSEHQVASSVQFEIINTGLRTVTLTNYRETASPRFGPDDSGDIAYDIVQVIPNSQLKCVFREQEYPLVGMLLAFNQSCSAIIQFVVRDNDPFDTFNPVPDFADWAVLLQVSAKETRTGDPVSDEIGHAYVRVVDDVVPEPGTVTLVSSGLLLVMVLYRRRNSRSPVR